MQIRPATLADLTAIDGTPPPHTARAMAAVEDGQTIGVWGIYPFNTRYVLFSSFSARFRQRRRNFVRAVASARALIASRPPLPVIAVADPAIEGSQTLLRHMGFSHLHGSIWQWRG